MKLLLFSIFTLFAFRIFAQTPNAVAICYADGEDLILSLDGTPKCTFDEGGLIVSAEGKIHSFQLEGDGVSASLIYFNFSEIKTMAEDGKVVVIPTSFGVAMEGLKPGEQVMAFDLNGCQSASATASSQGTLSMTLPAGLSVIKTTSRSFKIMR